MVLLTMTPAIAAAVEACQNLADEQQMNELQPDPEPSLAAPEPGKPISHGQLINISEFLKKHDTKAEIDGSTRPVLVQLNDLLRGSKIYVPPPPPKPEPSPEYKALMARLRAEEEARAYERMLNPPPPTETFSQRFPAATPNAFLYPTSIDLAKEEEDEVTYADVNRQLALIANVLISIIACSVAIWIAARHWSVPRRLALSMVGSITVAVAEVAIYMGYLRRVKEAKVEEKNRKEVREVSETWVIDGKVGKKKMLAVEEKTTPNGVDTGGDNVRFRKGRHR